MSVVYLDEQGAELRRRRGRLSVEKAGTVVAEVPEAQLDRLIIIGNVQITTQALSFLLDRGIPTCFVTTRGRYRGKLSPLASKNVPLRVQQYRREGDARFALHFAKAIVRAKIANGRSLLQHHRRNHPEAPLEQDIAGLGAALERIDQCPSHDTLRGIEGAAATHHFRALGNMVRTEFVFERRSKRPPRDPVNSLLSFGYSLLCNEVLGALASVGLDPFLGYFHEVRYGRPSLAVDMMEEWRFLADALALSLVNRGQLKTHDFTSADAGGCYLTEGGRSGFFTTYERQMHREVLHPVTGEKATYRRMFLLQARCLAKAIEGDRPYVPFRAQ